MARLAVVVAVFLALAGAAGARVLEPPDLPASQEASGAQSITEVAGLERRVFQAVNAVRRQHGLVPLRLNRGLGEAARGHSQSMAEHGFFRHTSYDGSEFWRRIKSVYQPLAGRSWSTGENLVWASPELSAEEAVDLWMKSPP